MAGFAFVHAGNADLGLDAVRRLLERDLQVVAQVRAAIDGRAPAAPAAEDVAENVAEDVAESGRTARAALRVDAGMAELVVGGALVGVVEHLVGFLGLLELLLGLRLSGLRSGWYFIASLR